MRSEDTKLAFGPKAAASLVFLVVVLFGFVLASQFRGPIGALGIGGLIYLSAAMVGALLGFIFAVPRVIARADSEPQADGTSRKVLDTNTNLERISDWLTTMLVGVGLSQLTNLDTVFVRFRTFLEQTAKVHEVGGVPDAGVLPAVGPFILILGAASGFLFMYLLTRLVLIEDFRDSEDKTLSRLARAAVRAAVTPALAGPTEIARDGDSPTGDEDAARSQAPRPGPAPATSATLLRASQASSLSNEDALEVMFELLYEPDGYRGVIEMSRELSRTSVARNAEFWFYLAAAYGQLMHHAAEGSDERAAARESALNAAQEAVRLDKSYRDRLWSISNPDSTDDDLAPLRHDPAFLRLVGRKAAQA